MTDGQLNVAFKSSSDFLGRNLPLEVRDAKSKLLARSAGPVRMPLPEGLYIVEATLPGGVRHSEVVAVKAGEATDVELSAAASDPPRNAIAEGAVLAAAPPDDIAPVLMDYRACELADQTGPTWTFDPVGDPDETPMATFDVDGRKVTASLPVNPGASVEERACVVTFHRRAGRARADVGFTRQRRVAWTLEGLVKSDDLVSTADLFEHADQLLYSKYKDPAAAALGGLTLHRIGRLRVRSNWVENLARDFPWVVDGRVLLAAVLSNTDAGDERARGLATLLEAAPSRPLFSDGLALLIRLLRHWPDGAQAEARRTALAGITSDPLTVDWDAMALTMYDEA